MQRYIVERTFTDGWQISGDAAAADTCLEVVRQNADEGVTWIQSYVSDDARKTFCVYEAPSPEAIRKAAARNALPIDHITQVGVLDPYFCAYRMPSSPRSDELMKGDQR
jgi:hypothetical protein